MIGAPVGMHKCLPVGAAYYLRRSINIHTWYTWRDRDHYDMIHAAVEQVQTYSQHLSTDD